MGIDHKLVGIAYGPHSEMGFSVVIVYGDQIIDKESKEIEEYMPKEKSNEAFTKNWEKFTQDIFTYQNKIRENPKSFIPHLDKCIRRF